MIESDVHTSDFHMSFYIRLALIFCALFVSTLYVPECVLEAFIIIITTVD